MLEVVLCCAVNIDAIRRGVARWVRLGYRIGIQYLF